MTYVSLLELVMKKQIVEMSRSLMEGNLVVLARGSNRCLHKKCVGNKHHRLLAAWAFFLPNN